MIKIVSYAEKMLWHKKKNEWDDRLFFLIRTEVEYDRTINVMRVIALANLL
jgi:hypothetical protein